jgi:hypothetical protein
MNQRAKKVRAADSVDQPLLRVWPRDLDTLLSTLDARFVALSGCLVSAGFRLEMGGIDAPGIHVHYLDAVVGRAISILRDPQIARAFSEMAAQPGRHHRFRVAECAALSRSTFVQRLLT